ncbi:MAG: UDP-2,4-diacetamido-2,4,6-trideoxy-beta-L-altropyranose hydrolase [Chthoniobacter sp.]|nr:UDP-2,4-diacetamido-2,4,6-trideoxy-beta-L-altropyranose hydrolase [Chthoniobacter sp.]
MVRADASPAIGTGHVMRSLALAQSWCGSRDPGTAVKRAAFLMSSTTAAIDERLRTVGMTLARLEAPLGTRAEVEETIRFAREAGAGWVVLDGYHFLPDMQGALRAAGLRVLCIDDNGDAADYQADVILNHNFHARAELYPHRSATTRLLLGPGYALLRPEFTAAWPTRRTPPVARKLLVTLGGADPANATQMVLAALQELPIEGLEVVVVVGGSNLRQKELEQLAAGIGAHIRVVHDAPNMAELMAWADLAVATASVTTLELACMGLPALLMVLAENQRLIAEYLHEQGLARYLGWHHELNPVRLREAIFALAGDPKTRDNMSARGRSLVDGRGAGRVAAELSKAA